MLKRVLKKVVFVLKLPIVPFIVPFKALLKKIDIFRFIFYAGRFLKYMLLFLISLYLLYSSIESIKILFEGIPDNYYSDLPNWLIYVRSIFVLIFIGSIVSMIAILSNKNNTYHDNYIFKKIYKLNLKNRFKTKGFKFNFVPDLKVFECKGKYYDYNAYMMLDFNTHRERIFMKKPTLEIEIVANIPHSLTSLRLGDVINRVKIANRWISYKDIINAFPDYIAIIEEEFKDIITGVKETIEYGILPREVETYVAALFEGFRMMMNFHRYLQLFYIEFVRIVDVYQQSEFGERTALFSLEELGSQSTIERLKAELERAVREENYERAAVLRDKIEELQKNENKNYK